ncbi:MAG TPA: universal stress protein [Acidimicrobiales bacterium]|nr:universal stress protein [Acidimicrobiales bacterium]
MFDTVVVGADESMTAADAVRAAAAIVKMSGGQLHIVTAYKPKPAADTGSLPEEFRYTTTANPADVLLSDLALMVKDEGLEPVVHAATSAPAEALVQVAIEQHADLIVVGNKGMKGAKRVLGSVPNSVAHHAPCSVLIVDTTG